MGEVGCLKDGNFQNLQVESNFTIVNTLALAEEPITWSADRGALPDFIYNNGIYTTTLGLMPTWNANFGAAVAAATGPYVGAADVLTPLERMTRLALSLRGIAKQTSVITTAQSDTLFGSGGIAGTDVAIAAIATPIAADGGVTRLTGNLAASVTMTASADSLPADTNRSLILFTGNTFTASDVLTLEVHTNMELDAESSEFITTTNVTGGTTDYITEREDATTDLHAKVALTNGGGGSTTILAGSFIYFERLHDTDITSVKMCLLTTGAAKIVISTANN
jgi:hypothetical protein